MGLGIKGCQPNERLALLDTSSFKFPGSLSLVYTPRVCVYGGRDWGCRAESFASRQRFMQNLAVTLMSDGWSKRLVGRTAYSELVLGQSRPPCPAEPLIATVQSRPPAAAHFMQGVTCCAQTRRCSNNRNGHTTCTCTDESRPMFKGLAAMQGRYKEDIVAVAQLIFFFSF